MNKPTDYQGIKLWGFRMGSGTDYVHDQQVLAVRDNAPIKAIFRRHGSGLWITIDDLPIQHPFRKQWGGQPQPA